jgi:hypothetical protein
VFDDPNLVSYAGLAAVLVLAERAGLSELVSDRVALRTTKVKSAGVNPAGKLTSVIAGMAAGADSIEDLDVIRCGGIPALFGDVYAGTTLGQFLREFSHGHTLQLASVARAHLVRLVGCSGLLPGVESEAYVDIDSLLRPVYGHAKQGASFGHTKIAGRQVLRRGLSPLVTTISTTAGAPVVAGIRLRAGRAGSGKGAASMVRDAIGTARAAGAVGGIPGACGFGLRQHRGHRRVSEGWGTVLRRADQAADGQPGDSRHPGAGVDPSALPRRGR